MKILYQSMIDDINALACGIIAVRLFVWRLSFLPRSLSQGFIIYLFIISYADVTFRALFIEGYYTAWSELVINVSLSVFCCIKKKNIFEQVSN